MYRVYYPRVNSILKQGDLWFRHRNHEFDRGVSYSVWMVPGTVGIDD